MSHPQIDLFFTFLKEKDTAKMKGMLEEDPSLALAKYEDGVSILMYCIYFMNKEIENLILSIRPPADVHEAAATGNTEMVASMIGLDPSLLNAFYSDGFTPLGLAVYFGHLETAGWLLQSGADPSLPSNNPFMVTPLHSAAAAGRTELARQLIDHGARVNERQASGVTALHSAAHNGNFEMAVLLVEAGADCTAMTETGKTPFDMAIEAGFENVANYLQRKQKPGKKTFIR